MNKPLMEEFLKYILIDNNYETANAVKDMLSDLIYYRRDKIINEFKYCSFPFIKVGPWNNLAIIDQYQLDGSNFAIDIIVDEKMYKVQFFDRNYADANSNIPNTAVIFLEYLEIVNEFVPIGLRMEKLFKFPEQEDELYRFLHYFINNVKTKMTMKSKI